MAVDISILTLRMLYNLLPCILCIVFPDFEPNMYLRVFPRLLAHKIMRMHHTSRGLADENPKSEICIVN